MSSFVSKKIQHNLTDEHTNKPWQRFSQPEGNVDRTNDFRWLVPLDSPMNSLWTLNDINLQSN